MTRSTVTKTPRPRRPAFDPDTFDAKAYVAQSRAAQGLPPTIEDPECLRRVAQLLYPRGVDANGNAL